MKWLSTQWFGWIIMLITLNFWQTFNRFLIWTITAQWRWWTFTQDLLLKAMLWTRLTTTSQVQRTILTCSFTLGHNSHGERKCSHSTDIQLMTTRVPEPPRTLWVVDIQSYLNSLIISIHINSIQLSFNYLYSLFWLINYWFLKLCANKVNDKGNIK